MNTRACLPPHDTYPFCDVTKPIDERVDDLISRIEMDEIPPLLTAREGGGDSPGPPGNISRIGLPEYDWGVNCIHGVQTTCTTGTDGSPRCPTSFPNPNALGATFNASMWKEMGSIIGRELRALWVTGATEASSWSGKPHAGLDCWSPNININRDPRWGRNQEVPSEDPYINGVFGTSYTVGLQNGTDPRYLQAVVTLKHWDAYSLEDSDGFTRHSFNAVVDNYTLADTFLPAFKMTVVEGGAKGVMCSYNSLNGVPTCASPFLNHILRDVWQFKGYVTSDTGAVEDILQPHHYVNTSEDAVAVALRDGGCDIDSGKVYSENLVSAVTQNKLSMDDVKTALHRTLKLRFQLGLFDPIEDQPYWHVSPDEVSKPENQATNLLSTLESMVLLSNNKGVLPLGTDKKVALIGPHVNATKALVGNYLGELCPGNTFDCVESVSDAMLAVNPSSSITLGCALTEDVTHGVDNAVKAAKAADVAVLFLGIDGSLEGESHDRTSVGIPAPQIALAQAVAATGVPTVVVLLNGGMVELEPILALNVPILEAFYPGFWGAKAIAKTLFGMNENLGGKMPFTVYPQGYTDLVKMSDMSMRPSQSNPGRSYKYYTGTPTIPFGHGISLTTFKLKNVTSLESQSWPTVQNADTARSTYQISVTNTGTRTGDEVVLAFYYPTTGPKRVLCGFQRVHLAPGESTVVRFGVASETLKTVQDSGDTVTQPGSYKLEFTNGVDQSLFAPVELVGRMATLEKFPQSV